MAKTHEDVNFEVHYGGEMRRFEDPDAALSFAAHMAMSTGESTLDVIVWSRKGARFHGGDDAVERYEEDPEASVFERFEFKVNSVGRVA